MSLVISGRRVDVQGLRILSWHDDPQLRLRMGQDGRLRTVGARIRQIVLHTTKGIPGGQDQRPQLILPGRGEGGQGPRVARFWSTSPVQAGAHLVVDHDGVICCLADLQDEAAFHAGTANGNSIGIEMYQGSRAELYTQQLDQVVVLVRYLCAHFGLPTQMPGPYKGHPRLGVRAFCGVIGHRDVSENRGAGDPGDEIFRRLGAAGFEAVDW